MLHSSKPVVAVCATRTGCGKSQTSRNPMATVVFAKSPPKLEHGPDLLGKLVLVVEDGPTLTHGEMPFGAGLVAARSAGGAKIVDPRPYAEGSIKETFDKWPHLTNVLPAMGYSDGQLRALATTINAADCVVVSVARARPAQRETVALR